MKKLFILAVAALAFAAPTQTVAPTVLTEFGYDWQVRSGDLGAGSPWSGSGVTRYYKTGGPTGFTNRRIGLNAETASCGLKLLDVPAPARYTVYLEGALYTLDPSVVAAVWLYDDRTGMAGGAELDWEHTAWRDTHSPFRHHLGAILAGKDRLPGANVPATSAIYHKVVITQTETLSSVAVFDWRASDARWIEVATSSWNVSAKPGSTLRIAIWKNGAHVYPASQRGQSKLAIGGLTVEKL